MSNKLVKEKNNEVEATVEAVENTDVAVTEDNNEVVEVKESFVKKVTGGLKKHGKGIAIGAGIATAVGGICWAVKSIFSGSDEELDIIDLNPEDYEIEDSE